jgi:phosphoribosylformylglycinamidine synthase
MTPYEIMLSESQERMLLVVQRGREEEVRRVFARWELDAVEIGHVTGDGLLRARMHGEVVAEVPVRALADEAPVYDRPRRRPEGQDALLAVDPLGFPPVEPARALLAILGSPGMASKEWVYRQYDQQVGINSLVLPGSDAGILRIRGTAKGVALTTDGNARFVLLDPRVGAAMAVAEAARNLAAAGARPLGLTDCLNFGSPERPEILWQFEEAVEGIAAACEALGIPVVGGNVSFYNETLGQAVLPTPVIGMAGLLDDARRRCTQWLQTAGDRIALLGAEAVSLGGSEWLWALHGTVAGRLAPLDLDLERRVHDACRAAIDAGLLRSAHDCAEGGLAATVAECCMSGPAPIGAALTLPAGPEAPALTLFGEGPSRIVVSVAPGQTDGFARLMAECAVPWRWLGTAGGDRLVIRLTPEGAPGQDAPPVLDVSIDAIAHEWRSGFARHLG